ncbi:MAG: OmpH family outer membrane protein [Alphaproteobacteria bacterium]|nr:OmpH family outer membrane protein [Alphaproteobacteria bacterium]MBQ8557427.1 OmpH family outer membrane protein [Alphaproteobacteria bacterium]
MTQKNNLIQKGGIVLAVGISLVALTCCLRDSHTSKVGVLDNQRVFKEAVVFQIIAAEETKYLNALTARQTEDEKMLTRELAELEKKIKDSKKGQDAFEQEISVFQQKVSAYAQKYQTQKQLIAKASMVARQQADPFIREVLADLGQSGYDVIVSKAQTEYFSEKADLTNRFLKQLNEKDIQISFPNPAQFLVAQTVQNQISQQVAQNTTEQQIDTSKENHSEKEVKQKQIEVKKSGVK